MEYNTLVFIGRFQPFHNGHKAVVEKALSLADKVALVIGSHEQPRNTRNPFTTAERIEMISAVFPEEVKAGRIHFVPQVDHTYNMDRWIAGVQTGVASVAHKPWTAGPIKIGLIGHSKDHSSFYLKSFPTWSHVEVDNVNNINATTIRQAFIADGGNTIERQKLPESVVLRLDLFKAMEPAWEDLREEQEFLINYRLQWRGSPYPPTFNTVDGVVVQSGHILLVQRKAQPGRGLWALPGGFINTQETLKEAVIRELREETRLAVPDPVLLGSLIRQQVFDDPHRSQRGRTITTAFYFKLSDREELPKIKGGDDAAKARWVPLSEVRRDQMFEDHYDIIETMVNI